LAFIYDGLLNNIKAVAKDVLVLAFIYDGFLNNIKAVSKDVLVLAFFRFLNLRFSVLCAISENVSA
jgi:hypothetical protein